MAYEPYNNEYEHKNEDLHNYFMTQFNLELENKPKKLDAFKHGNEESFNFEAVENWNHNNSTDFGLDSVIENDNVSDESIKDVLLDLDSLEYDTSDNATYKNKLANTKHKTNDYIDDESLIDELCREESDSRLTPDIFNDDYLSSFTKEKKLLPSMETAFSKRFCNYNPQQSNTVVIQNLEYYSYPNNIIQNLENESYVLPDTPTSCTEFTYDRTERKASVCESIESDLHSSSYYDGNSETFDEDELFVNLDDFGLNFEDDAVNVPEAKLVRHCERIADHPKHGDRHCFWESCFEKYPNQSTLVEHIERAHVNTYKGDEFSCLWQNCARSRRPFNARYKLLIHMRVHSGHKPNRCHHPGCGKAFSRLENLKIHMRSHTGERPYACPAPHCRKAFSNSSDRAKHQRTHFNARPYACGAPGCGKRYTDPSSLRKHVKSHPHITTVPRSCIPPSRPFKRAPEQMVPSSPAKLATMRSIRDKLTVSRVMAV